MTYRRKTKPALWTTIHPPSKPSKPVKAIRRTRVRQRSKQMDALMQVYRWQKKAFMAKPENRMCGVFPWLKAQDIHHIRGRVGPLLLDERFWLPVSRFGHNWIEQHRQEAQRRGWLAGAGEWNSPEP